MVTGDSKVSIFDLDSIKTTLILKPSLVLDTQPARTIFAHNKPMIDARIPRDNDSVLITLAKDNSLVMWDINSGLAQKKFLFESEATCFDIVTIFDVIIEIFRTIWVQERMWDFPTEASMSAPSQAMKTRQSLPRRS